MWCRRLTRRGDHRVKQRMGSQLFTAVTLLMMRREGFGCLRAHLETILGQSITESGKMRISFQSRTFYKRRIKTIWQHELNMEIVKNKMIKLVKSNLLLKK